MQWIKKEEFIGQTGQLKSFVDKPLTLETKVTYIESRFPFPYKLNILFKFENIPLIRHIIFWIEIKRKFFKIYKAKENKLSTLFPSFMYLL